LVARFALVLTRAAYRSIPTSSTKRPALAFRPENEDLRDRIQRLEYDESAADSFRCTYVTPRMAPTGRKSFEPAWREYREGGIYDL
jgi:hypothetical protein